MRTLLFETLTGNPIRDLKRSAWDYTTGILAPDKGSVTIPAYTEWSRGIMLRDELVPFKHSIALIDESVAGVRHVPAAGVLLPPVPESDTDGRQSYRCPFRGIEMLWQYRTVKKYPAWPLIGGDSKPTGTYDQTFENLEYGTIIKHMVQESEKFPNGALPIEYEADRVGVHERTRYKAIDKKPILEAADQISALMDGVEYDLQPRVDEYDHISFRLVTGTDAERAIIGTDAHVWNLGGPNPDIDNWTPADVLDDIATDTYFLGGKEGDKVMIARASDPTLLDAGWPRIERWDSSHSTVAKQATLQSWADGALNHGYRRFNLRVKAERARFLRHGDVVQIAADGHWDEPSGVNSRRVVSVGRDSTSPDWVKVQLI